MTVSRKKIVIAVVVILLAGYAAFFNHVWAAMHKSPEGFGRVMAGMPEVAYFLVPFETLWMRARAGTLQAGDAAPDFTLEKLDKTGTVQLSALTAQQPVVLVFGSYT